MQKLRLQYLCKVGTPTKMALNQIRDVFSTTVFSIWPKYIVNIVYDFEQNSKPLNILPKIRSEFRENDFSKIFKKKIQISFRF